MTSMTRIEPLSIWWADVKLEMVADGEFYISKESFERPVLIIDNKAYLVFKITSRLGRLHNQRFVGGRVTEGISSQDGCSCSGKCV